MKYYLSLDKGQVFKNKDRYIKIDLSEINEKLIQDNNLKALVTFTCSFENVLQLKEFLNAKGLIEKKNINCHLVLTYVRDYIHFREIPFKEDAKYLNFRNLEELICYNSKKPGFLDAIIQNYSKLPHLSPEIYSFRGYLSNPYADYKFYDVVRSFVSKICFREKSGKKVINYKGLFDLGMLISKLTKSKEAVETVVKSEKETMDREPQYSEDDPRYHHLEELKDRYEKEQEDQIRLF